MRAREQRQPPGAAYPSFVRGTMAPTRGPRPSPAKTLDALPEKYWWQLRRVSRPGRPDMLIDHVLVGPSGIYVIGYLPSEPDRPAAATTGCELHAVYDVGAAACVEQAGTIRGLLLARYRDRVRPVLCLGGNDGRAEEVRGVLVASLATLEHIVRSSPPILSTSEVAQVGSALQARLEQVPVLPGPSRRHFRVALRTAAAFIAVAAASGGVLVLGPDTIELFGIRH